MVGQPTSPSVGGRPHLDPSGSSSHVNVERNKLDALGEFIRVDSKFYLDTECWTRLFHSRKGRSNFARRLRHLRHRAAPLLHRFASRGVPVLITSKPWSLAKKDAAMQRGNHPSAHAFTDFLREEMGDMRERGMFIMLPYHMLRHMPQLRISPLGYVPQREHRPRMINDYTFSGVNPDTVKMAPQEAMQWGRTLHRILWFVYNADRRHGPVLLSKTDLSDGFYQLHLSPSGALKLAVPFPNLPHEPPLVAIPTRLPMGWTESPPAFSAATETMADLANELLEQDPSVPPAHPLESAASTPVPLTPSTADPFHITKRGPIRPPLAYIDVYVDDFVKLAQGWLNCLRVRRAAFNTIDQVFRPNDSHDSGRRPPISLKKLLKGDDFWSTQKIILGWLLDTVANTISLPPHRRDRLLDLLCSISTRKRTSVQEWHQLLGELRSMSLSIPGSRGCFSFLQHALRPGAKCIKITRVVRDQLRDFLWLAEDLSSRPTHLAEVVPTEPTYFGAMDASKAGMGGVWFPPGPPLPNSIIPSAANCLSFPCLWRSQFSPEIQARFVSTSNPTGSVSNSDLELAGTIAHDDVLATTVPLTHVTTCAMSDNTPAVSWRGKGSATTTGPAAYLLQVSSLHQRHFRYKPELHHISGTANKMADECSRRWDLTDSELISYFNSTFPQMRSWQMLHLRPEMNSALTSALLERRLPPESYLQESAKPSVRGAFGSRFAPPSMSTPSMADPVSVLQAFAIRWRDGRISPSGNPNKARSVEDAVRLVCQKFPSLGAPDPRIDARGKQDFCLTRMWSAWKKEDDPPVRAEPVPMSILLRATLLCADNVRDRATMDCIWMAFYFLLRPGEYANASGDAKHPFRLADVEFKIGAMHYFNVMLVDPPQFDAATFVSLTFTDQKNGIKGEKLAHCSNGQLDSCPVRAVMRRVSHLVSHNAPPTTPLHVYYDERNRRRAVSSAMVTSLLRAAVLTIPGHAGVDPEKVAARSLRASGAMSLLLGGVDPDQIRIVGRWRSDAMFRYLHAHALPLIQNNSRLMFHGGHYQLINAQCR